VSDLKKYGRQFVLVFFLPFNFYKLCSYTTLKKSVWVINTFLYSSVE